MDKINGRCDFLMITRGLKFLFRFISSCTECRSYLKVLQKVLLEFPKNMQNLNRIGFANSILILRVAMIINSTLVEKFLKLPSSASQS